VSLVSIPGRELFTVLFEFLIDNERVEEFLDESESDISCCLVPIEKGTNMLIYEEFFDENIGDSRKYFFHQLLILFAFFEHLLSEFLARREISLIVPERIVFETFFSV
jgi:hypothetical protein